MSAQTPFRRALRSFLEQRTARVGLIIFGVLLLAAIGADAVKAASTGATRTIDLDGAFVMPGFIDCHFHAYGFELDMMKSESTPRSYVALKGRTRLEAALQRGFTTVRDVAANVNAEPDL